MSAPALIVEGREISYARLTELAGDAASRVRGLLGPAAEAEGGPVRPALALVADRDLASVLGIVAADRLGAPLALLHPRWTAAECAAQCQRLGLERVVRAEAVPSAAAVALPAPALSSLVPDASERCRFVLFTSGSSGVPKAVVLSRRAFARAAAASAAVLGWRAHDRWLLSMPLAHVGGLAILDRCLRAGATVVLQEAQAFDPTVLHRQIVRDRVTLLSLVPTMLHRLVEAGLRAPRTVRAVLLGGAPVSPALLERGRALGWPLLPTYGMTEACSQVATVRPDAALPGLSSAAGAGARPLPGVEVRIAGAEGEIQIRSATLFSGYLVAERAALDRSAFTADGWFRTGDLGSLDDTGALRVLGRRAETILSGGENVSPLEVEGALEEVPGVLRACVFGVPDPEWGERVAAAIVAAPGFDERQLVAHLERRLASFKRPRALVRLDELPLLPSGKVDRARCAAMARSRL